MWIEGDEGEAGIGEIEPPFDVEVRDGKGVTDAIPKRGVGKRSQLWTCQASVT